MKRLLRELLFGAAMAGVITAPFWISGPAYAGESIFYDSHGWWSVYGWTDTAHCQAEAQYDNGRQLRIGFMANGEEAFLTVAGLRVIPGKSYEMHMYGSTDAGIMYMTGLEDGSGMFAPLHKSGVRLLKDSTYLSIQGVGDFSLKGSAAAMLKAFECSQVVWHAVTSPANPVSEPAPPTGRDGPKLWM